MKDFLQGALAAVIRRIDRLQELLDRVPVFSRLQQKCVEVRALLNQRRDEAEEAITFLTGPPEVLENVVGQYKAVAREVYLVEQVFVGPVSRFSEEDESLSRLCERVCEEIGISADIPIVLAASNQYFCTIPAFGVIFTPASEFRSLLNLPDLYHEIGHHLHRRGRSMFGPRFTAALSEYIDETVDEVTRLSRPVDIPLFRSLIGFWRNWAEEVAADAFATMVLGPAYAWANLHLMLRALSIFDYSRTHPADAARMENILRILRADRVQGEKVNLLEDQWGKYLRLLHLPKPEMYDLLHGPALFTAILEDVREAMNHHRLKTPGSTNGTVAYLLNEAWQRLPTTPSQYGTWESGVIDQIFR